MNARRQQIIDRLEVLDRKMKKVESATKQREELNEATEYMLEHSEKQCSRFTSQMQKVERDLETARTRLIGWRQRLRELAEVYDERRKKVSLVQEKQRAKATEVAKVEAEVEKLRGRIKELQRRHEMNEQHEIELIAAAQKYADETENAIVRGEL